MTLLTIDMFGNSKARYNNIEAFPTKEEILSMAKAGYKFKIDGKTVSKNQIESIRKITEE